MELVGKARLGQFTTASTSSQRRASIRQVALPDWAKGGDAKAVPVDRNRVG
jgi:hypothetical protein